MIQMQPPVAKIIIIPDLPTLQQGYSLQSHSETLLDTPVSLKNRANIDSQKDYRPRSPLTRSQNRPETSVLLPPAVQEVHPSLGTTFKQRQQLQLAMHSQDIQDILGMEIVDIHTHFKQFRITLKTEFKYLKQATAKNNHNLYTNLTLQQAYTSTLGVHIKNIYVVPWHDRLVTR